MAKRCGESSNKTEQRSSASQWFGAWVRGRAVAAYSEGLDASKRLSHSVESLRCVRHLRQSQLENL
eukprot:877109-Amphidinium_carterae.1